VNQELFEKFVECIEGKLDTETTCRQDELDLAKALVAEVEKQSAVHPTEPGLWYLWEHGKKQQDILAAMLAANPERLPFFLPCLCEGVIQGIYERESGFQPEVQCPSCKTNYRIRMVERPRPDADPERIPQLLMIPPYLGPIAGMQQQPGRNMIIEDNVILLGGGAIVTRRIKIKRLANGDVEVTRPTRTTVPLEIEVEKEPLAVQPDASDLLASAQQVIDRWGTDQPGGLADAVQNLDGAIALYEKKHEASGPSLQLPVYMETLRSIFEDRSCGIEKTIHAVRDVLDAWANEKREPAHPYSIGVDFNAEDGVNIVLVRDNPDGSKTVLHEERDPKPEPVKIVVTVDGGVVQSVDGIPAGVNVEVWDFDTDGVDMDDLPGTRTAERNYRGEQYIRSEWGPE
jgi:hypothetical protein